MASFLPQALTIWRDHDITGVSHRMYILTAIGFALWIAYGLFRAEIPIIVTNSVCFILSFAILVKLIASRRREP